MRNLTAEQQAAASARRDKFRALAKKLSAMPAAADRAALAAKLPVIMTIEGRALSPFNMCLIAAQFSGATIVGGFRQWKRAGRAVRKGEHGLSLWCPFRAKADGVDAEGDVRFGMGTVFDVSQTEELQAQAAAAA